MVARTHTHPFRFHRTAVRATAALVLVGFLVMPLTVRAQPDEHRPNHGAYRAVESFVDAVAHRDVAGVQRALADASARDLIAEPMPLAALHALTIYDVRRPIVTTSGDTARAEVRWKARFSVSRFVASRQAAEVAHDLPAAVENGRETQRRLRALGMALREVFEAPVHVFAMRRGADGWRVDLPASWREVLQDSRGMDAVRRYESAADAAEQILRAYRDGDLEALAERVVPEGRESFERIGRRVLAATEVRAFELIAVAEGASRAKATYRWVCKFNLPLFAQASEDAMLAGIEADEERSATRASFRAAVREHGNAFREARERRRQTMLLKRVDGRWHLERIMAESIVDALAAEGAESAEVAANRAARSIVTTQLAQLHELLAPMARMGFWEEGRPLIEALVVEDLQVYRVDTQGQRATARIVWSAAFDPEAYVTLSLDVLRESLVERGVPPRRIAAELAQARPFFQMNAEEIDLFFGQARAQVGLAQNDNRWFVTQIGPDMSPPRNEVGTDESSEPFDGFIRYRVAPVPAD